jgi:hypothetical protein
MDQRYAEPVEGLPFARYTELENTEGWPTLDTSPKL